MPATEHSELDAFAAAQITKAREWHRVTGDGHLARQVHETFAARARLEAWRAFLHQDNVEFIERSGVSLSIADLGRDWDTGRLSFDRGVTEEQARAVLCTLVGKNGTGDFAEYEFKRQRLRDSEARITVPLACFVPCDGRVSPVLQAVIHKHWQVKREDFRVGEETKHYVKHKVLEFCPTAARSNPNCRWQKVAELTWEKGKTSAQWMELLIAEAYRVCTEEKSMWSIFEVEATKALFGQPAIFAENTPILT